MPNCRKKSGPRTLFLRKLKLELHTKFIALLKNVKNGDRLQLRTRHVVHSLECQIAEKTGPRTLFLRKLKLELHTKFIALWGVCFALFPGIPQRVYNIEPICTIRSVGFEIPHFLNMAVDKKKVLLPIAVHHFLSGY